MATLITLATTFVLSVILLLLLAAIGWDVKKEVEDRRRRYEESRIRYRRMRLYPYFGGAYVWNYDVAEKDGEYVIAYGDYVYPYNPDIHME